MMGTRVQDVDREENGDFIWTADDVITTMLISNASVPDLEISILYVNVSTSFGVIKANCTIVGLFVNCSLGQIPISKNDDLIGLFAKYCVRFFCMIPFFL